MYFTTLLLPSEKESLKYLLSKENFCSFSKNSADFLKVAKILYFNLIFFEDFYNIIQTQQTIY